MLKIVWLDIVTNFECRRTSTGALFTNVPGHLYEWLNLFIAVNCWFGSIFVKVSMVSTLVPFQKKSSRFCSCNEYRKKTWCSMHRFLTIAYINQYHVALKFRYHIDTELWSNWQLITICCIANNSRVHFLLARRTYSCCDFLTSCQ